MINLDNKSQSPATTPLRGPILMMIMELMLVRLMYSHAPARVGCSKQNYFLLMERDLLGLDIQSPFPVTIPSWEPVKIMIMEVIQARHMFSNAAA